MRSKMSSVKSPQAQMSEELEDNGTLEGSEMFNH